MALYVRKYVPVVLGKNSPILSCGYWAQAPNTCCKRAPIYWATAGYCLVQECTNIAPILLRYIVSGWRSIGGQYWRPILVTSGRELCPTSSRLHAFQSKKYWSCRKHVGCPAFQAMFVIYYVYNLLCVCIFIEHLLLM